MHYTPDVVAQVNLIWRCDECGLFWRLTREAFYDFQETHFVKTWVIDREVAQRFPSRPLY